jgi:transposase-like protein
MVVSKYQKEKINKLKKKAVKLYRQGLTLRDIEPIVGKSYEWIRGAVKELDKT